MPYFGWNESFLIECSTKLATIEGKLINEQIEYLHQYYAINRYPQDTELKEIAKQWNKDNIRFVWDLDDWFFCRRMADRAVEHRRQALRRIAA